MNTHSYAHTHNLSHLITSHHITSHHASRLHTVIERIVEEISFDAPSKRGEKIEVTEEYVKARVADLLKSSDLRKYIL